MATFAVSAMGRDQPGVVASISAILAEHGLNIEANRMGVLGGHVTLTLLCSSDVDHDARKLGQALERARQQLGLQAIAVTEAGDGDLDQPTHVLTIHGGDHPGIVHAFAQVFADHGVTIVDLITKLAEDQAGSYGMVMELVLPDDVLMDELQDMLGVVGRQEGVTVELDRAASQSSGK